MHNINSPRAHIHNQIFASHISKFVSHRRITLRKCQYNFNDEAVLYILIAELHRLLLTLQIPYKRLSHCCKMLQRKSHAKNYTRAIGYCTALTLLSKRRQRQQIIVIICKLAVLHTVWFLHQSYKICPRVSAYWQRRSAWPPTSPHHSKTYDLLISSGDYRGQFPHKIFSFFHKT